MVLVVQQKRIKVYISTSRFIFSFILFIDETSIIFRLSNFDVLLTSIKPKWIPMLHKELETKWATCFKQMKYFTVANSQEKQIEFRDHYDLTYSIKFSIIQSIFRIELCTVS